MKVLVCGGRDYSNERHVFGTLDAMHAVCCITQLIEGGANGADRLARKWAERRGIEVRTFDANWQADGRAAGPIRNQRMISEGKPDRVVAFPGGRGTEDMVRRAQKASVPVFSPTPTPMKA